MSEVHHAITAHSHKQHRLIKQFLQLDAQRERYIEEAVEHCRNGQTFTVEKINETTKQINELAKQGVVPQRKYVTVDMVAEYVERLKTKGERK
ncbi:YpbS family protein [Anoxybacillus rupiensis]|jgi:Protein of unknown function (DUF2533)|uniref:YpbS family protein n=1 Tax=Anoxybacteroides rupiense TaxID=311460 RepID=A0ABD5IVK1_9BACL|nr:MULTISPECIES: YpbS family protein [Anoxybacillus]MBB3907967.1 hypothetical protein [Anoxybacillus rupiensis]MBS2771773.1 YpbS family protein [Anoxybacillus rupiensis]MDE8563862.1 YpbS family protein [Anoxybacillus rupiensis]MED5051456.1 YpbS family protein [Anoxybacillus rupiensis]OQM46021.1 hypothetical protein B6A27_07395 [Anoxybacillus sp. UARK-01]